MKPTLIKHLFGLFISFLTFGAYAQCPTVSSFNTTYGPNGTATISPVLTNSASVNTIFIWTGSNGTYFDPNPSSPDGNLLVFANGNYSVCVYITDTISGCYYSQCTTINISNIPSFTCQASFTSYTDSNCVTHLSSSSTGSNLTYQWHLLNSGYQIAFSSISNPTVSLQNGNNQIRLFTYSNGAFCDSITQNIMVNCSSVVSPSNTCTASFSTYTDSLCVSHFINTSDTVNGNNATWYIGGHWFYNQNQVALSLPNGSCFVKFFVSNPSSNYWCDSLTQIINISCNTNTVPCQANANFQIVADTANPGNYFAYNYSTGYGNLSYLWNFGDGTTSSQQFPTHQYAVPGQYVICLTVSSVQDTTNCSDTYCDSSSVQKIASGYLMSQISVIPGNTTSVNNLNKNLKIVTYPNPINDELVIEIPKDQYCQYIITDAVGKIVINGHITQSKSVINTSDLAKGFYNLMIVDENNQKVNVKLVK